MKHIVYAVVFAGLAASSCAGSPPPEASSASAAPTTEGAPQAPDEAKARAHLEKHVQYPADRATILAACADTPEFSAGEKRWFEQHLPDRTYASAAEAIAAVGL
jgi:hypothetical protein